MVHNSYGYITCFSSGTVVMDRTFRPVIFCNLEAHSGLSHSYVTTNAASTIGANTSSLNTNTTSPSSSHHQAVAIMVEEEVVTTVGGSGSGSGGGSGPSQPQ